MYPLASFILQNFEKILRADKMCLLWAQNGPIVMNKIFLVQTIYYYFHLPIGLFHCAKFKKILPVDPEL